MFKILLLVRRKPELSHEEFREYYEKRHVPLILDSVPNARLYRRNYVQDHAQVAGLPGSQIDALGFDCVTEIGFATRQEAEAHIAAYLDPETHSKIAADEAKFIAPDGLSFVIVEPSQTADYSTDTQT